MLLRRKWKSKPEQLNSLSKKQTITQNIFKKYIYSTPINTTLAPNGVRLADLSSITSLMGFRRSISAHATTENVFNTRAIVANTADLQGPNSSSDRPRFSPLLEHHLSAQEFDSCWPITFESRLAHQYAKCATRWDLLQVRSSNETRQLLLNWAKTSPKGAVFWVQSQRRLTWIINCKAPTIGFLFSH